MTGFPFVRRIVVSTQAHVVGYEMLTGKPESSTLYLRSETLTLLRRSMDTLKNGSEKHSDSSTKDSQSQKPTIYSALNPLSESEIKSLAQFMKTTVAKINARHPSKTVSA